MKYSKFNLDVSSSNDYNNEIKEINPKNITKQRIIINLNAQNKNIIDILTEIKDYHILTPFNLDSREFCLTTYNNYSNEFTLFTDKNSKLPDPKFVIFFYEYVHNIDEELELIFNDGQVIKPTTGTVIFFNAEEIIKIKKLKKGFSTVIVFKFY